MAHYDDLIKKPHVANHPLIGGKKELARERAVTRMLVQAQEEKPDLYDDFSQALEDEDNLDGGDQKLSTLVYKASMAAQELLGQFNFPLIPSLKYINAYRVKRAATDEDKVISAEIRLEARIETLTGAVRHMEIPVHIVRGSIVPPSMVYYDGKEGLLTQSLVDTMIHSATSYALNPVRSSWSDPPMNKEELGYAVDVKNEMGYQPRENYMNYLNYKKMSNRKRQALRGGTPSGWQQVVDLMTKAKEDGTDTFPRAYDYLLKTYILEVVNTASKDAWETHLINAGWAYNPYAQNRGRHSASRANVSKDMDFEVSGKPDEVEDLSDFEKELMRVKL